MPLDPEFVAMLRCPESRQPVAEASADLLLSLNARIRDSSLLDRNGKPVRRELDGGLLREDGTLLYPVWDDLPDMLVQDAIPLEGSQAPKA